MWFTLQVLAIAALELGDDVFRGDIDPPDAQLAVQHAQQVARWEQAHGLFIEPALQLWARHGHAVFGLLSTSSLLRVSDLVYALGQTIVPLVLAVWMYRRHRVHFRLWRNISLLSTLFAVAGYEIFPTAPPRLTTGLSYWHHAFYFQNTAQGMIGDGKLTGLPLGYNAYSAIPSLHMAWALIVAGSVVLLAPSLAARLLAGLYPFIMLFAVVFTANHYLLDAVASAFVVALAAVIALALESEHSHLRSARSAIRRASADVTSSLLRSRRSPPRWSLPRKGPLMCLSHTSDSVTTYGATSPNRADPQRCALRLCSEQQCGQPLHSGVLTNAAASLHQAQLCSAGTSHLISPLGPERTSSACEEL